MNVQAIVSKKCRTLFYALVSLVALGSAPAALALEKVSYENFYPYSSSGGYLIIGTGTYQNDCCLYFMSNPTPLMMQALNTAYQMGTNIVDLSGVSSGTSYQFSRVILDRSADYNLIQPGAPYNIAVTNNFAQYGYLGGDASSSLTMTKYKPGIGMPCRPSGFCPDGQVYLYGTNNYVAIYSIQSAILSSFASGKYSGVPFNSVNPTSFTRDYWIWP